MKNTVYLHPLDYALGLKHYLLEESIDVSYSPSPDSFYVEEIIDLEGLSFGNGVDGEYLVYRVWKKGVDTWYAVKCFAGILNVPGDNVLFLGLKDRDSTSIQYFFVKKNVLRRINKSYIGSHIGFELIGSINRKPTKRILRGNRFRVIISGASHRDYRVARDIMDRILEDGLPSYYGYQRFGAHRPNTHILGRYLLAGRLDLFVDELLYRLYPGEEQVVLAKRSLNIFDTLLYEKRVASIISSKRSLSLYAFMYFLKGLFIDAYQSYLYNILLSKLVDEHGWGILRREYPMPACRGSDMYYRGILDAEGIEHDALLRWGRCWKRRGLFHPYDVEISYDNGRLIVEFSLDKGMYASIVLRELLKKKLVL